MVRLASLLLGTLILMTAGGAAPNSAATNDWPAWRGPDRNGISLERGLLREWPENGPAMVWKINGVGEGYSTPSVAGRMLCVMGNRDGQEWVFAFDRQQRGQLIWQTPVGPIRHDGAGYPGPRCTPTIEGERIYALGINGDLLCLNAADGKIVWRQDYVKAFGGQVPNWGYSESPLVDGPWLICTPGSNPGTLVALDKRDGRLIWKSDAGDTASYASPIRAEIDGLKQYVQFTQQGIIGVDAASGRFLWRYNAPANGTANAATPVWSGNRVMSASGYGTGGGMVEVTRSGNMFSPREVFFSKEIKNHHGGLVLVDGYVYGANDPGLLMCIEFATGKVKWANRTPGKCSMIYADGMFITRSEEGPVSLVAVNPEKCEVLSQFSPPDNSGRPTWPHPVIAGGRLYLRDQDNLQCYELTRAAK